MIHTKIICLNNNKHQVFIAIIFLLLSQSILAKQPPPDFYTLISKITSLQANFEQVSYQANQANLGKILKGRLQFKAPDQLKWHQTQPSEQIILIKSGLNWVYDVELEQVVKRKNNLKNTPLSWLFGFNPKQAPQFLRHDKQQDWYQLISQSKLVFEFGFNKEQQLTTIIFTDTLGGKTHINLSNHNNSPLDDLTLKTPDGVDVIDYTNN